MLICSELIVNCNLNIIAHKMDDLDFEADELAPVAAPVELGDNPVDWGENDVIGTIDWETIPGYTFDQTDPIEGPLLDDQELAYAFCLVRLIVR